MEHHHGPAPRASPRVRRRLALAVVPFAVATLAGLALLWPGDVSQESVFGAGPVPRQYNAAVVEVDEGACDAPPVTGFTCAVVEVELEGGPDEGDRASFEFAEGEGVRKIGPGDAILVGRSPGAPEAQAYYFVDYRRDVPLLFLGAIFAAMVVALSRLKGLSALLGLGISLAVLVWFVLPAILEGSSPLAVAIVGAAAIMFVTLYMAHGISARTTTAVLGTLVSLTLTGVLAFVFVELGRFTGLASEEAAFLQVSAGQVNLEGLFLGGIIIGALGVLDDVTVTQASAVWELHRAQPDYGVRNLYGAALRIGRDHIAATVNTLVLAYAGASLPLLILFNLSDRSFATLATTEVVATEIVRTLVGSIGLVASVPITTALAAAVVRGEGAPAKKKSKPKWQPPPAELEWRDG
ncbi:MAG: YibE/F family protein [Actinomycetota bacterium]